MEISATTSEPSINPCRFSRSQEPAAHYDAVILGGGINGAGVFRDLSLQGVNCLLVDSGDFCAGASAAPSRLIHGGIKYLETGEFRLVAQSTLERNLLLRNAPHYVKPIETVLPVRSWFGGIMPSLIRFFGGKAKLNDRGILITKVGLELFDFLGRRRRVLPRHAMAFGRSVHKAFPEMAADIIATATYYDAKVTSAERLGLELLLDGMQANPGSLAINHCALAGAAGAALWLQDSLGKQAHHVTADVVINAAGAWIDRVNANLGLATAYIGGAKGSHLILDNLELFSALAGKMVYFGASDGRVGLLYPFLGQVLVGSTDMPIADPDLAVCEDFERDYMLAIVREVFPRIGLSAGQVKYVYSGVRPLPKSASKDAGSVSRDHSIAQDRMPGSEVPVYSLIGGKWTTFRGFAEEAADRVLGHLARPRRMSTQNEPIGGGRNFPGNIAEHAKAIDGLAALGLERQRCATLLERYGSRATQVAKHCAKAGDAPLSEIAGYSRQEIGFIFQNEIAGRLADVVFRRTDIALSGRLTWDVAGEVARIGAQALGWDESRVASEMADVADIAHNVHRIAGFDLCPGPEHQGRERQGPDHEGRAKTRDPKTTERQP